MTQKKKVKTLYKEFKGLQSQLPLPTDRPRVANSVVDDFNSMVTQLGNEIGENLDKYSVKEQDRWGDKQYNMLPLRTQIGRVIGFLEDEFDEGQEAAPVSVGKDSSQPQVVVINQNQLLMTMTQNFQQVIDSATSKEEKEKLKELQEELEKPDKDWNKIKGILKWAMDFSEKLFFALVPFLLKYYGLEVGK